MRWNRILVVLFTAHFESLWGRLPLLSGARSRPPARGRGIRGRASCMRLAQDAHTVVQPQRLWTVRTRDSVTGTFDHLDFGRCRVCCRVAPRVLLGVWELESKNAGIWSARDQTSACEPICGTCAKPRQIGLRAHSAAPAHPWGPARHPQRPRRPPPPQARLGRQPCPHCFIHPWHRHCDPRTGSPIFR